ncbi:hypothetical protein GCM10010424_61760 [Streptomyces lienomycini]
MTRTVPRAASRAMPRGGSRLRRAARSLFGRWARLRWIHLVLGGALAVPYVLVGSAVVGPVAGGANAFGPFRLQLLSFALGLPLAAVTSPFPPTRPLESGVVRWLCGVEADGLAYGPAPRPTAPAPPSGSSPRSPSRPASSS